MTQGNTNRLNRSGSGFTLVELLTVLVILAVSVAVTVPYARKSNDVLLLERECRSIAETMKYALNCAEDTRKPVRFTIDLARRRCAVEAATDSSGSEYVLVEDGQRMSFTSSEKIAILDVQGFQIRGDASYSMVFDLSRTWPTGSVLLAAGDTTRKIVVAGRLISIEGI